MPTPDGRSAGQQSQQSDRRAFGSFIRGARRARSLSQAALAKAIAVSPVFISQIETGQRIPSDRVARAAATVLGLPWQDVLRSVYMLRSQEAGELFAAAERSGEVPQQSIAEIPAVRLLLLQLAGLELPPAEVETLVNNWTNDVRFLKEQLGRVQSR